MTKRAVVLFLSIAMAIAAFASPALADKSGCPNAHAENGASHANSGSAHGPDKQAQRGCLTQSASLVP